MCVSTGAVHDCFCVLRFDRSLNSAVNSAFFSCPRNGSFFCFQNLEEFDLGPTYTLPSHSFQDSVKGLFVVIQNRSVDRYL